MKIVPVFTALPPRFLAPAFLACLSFAPPLAARNGCDDIAERAGTQTVPSRVTEQDVVQRESSLASMFDGLSVDGFFDLRTTSTDATGEVVSSADFELNVAKDVADRVAVSATIAGNSEGATVSAAAIDIRLGSGRQSPSGSELDVRIGRFDVPFGNDWRSFAAKDRTELSAPLTTEAIMDGGYNAVGVQLHGRHSGIAGCAGVMRGSRGAMAYSGRLALAPFDTEDQTKRFESGVSLLFASGRGTNTSAIAFDADVQFGALHVRAEHVRKQDRVAETSTIRDGWHVTAALDAGEVLGVTVTPFARFDTAGDDTFRFMPGRATQAADARRLTAGLRAVLRNFLCKVEYTRSLAGSVAAGSLDGFESNSLTMQLVIGF